MTIQNSKMIGNLEQSIFKTIVFYDLLDLPLTGFEIQKYLIRQPSTDNRQPQIKLSDILEALENVGFLKEKIGRRNGFYFSSGRDCLVEDRIEKQKLADLKWKKLRRMTKFFWAFPFLKMAMATGSFALGNVKEESDFDVLMVARHNRIWTLRFFSAIFLSLLGMKRGGRKIKDKICLSHYISDRALAIGCRNVYEAQYYARAVPLAETEKNFYARFCEENRWMADFLFLWPPAIFEAGEASRASVLSQKNLPERKFPRLFAKVAEKMLDGNFGDFLEKILATAQKFHINRNPLKQKEGSRSRTDDFELEFRPDSNSLAVVKKFESLMSSEKIA